MKNVDTDVIIPAHWLKTTSRSGLGEGAFEVSRQKPGNVFDDPEYAGSTILIAGDNRGSSREHAGWALADLGIKVVIAPSFSEIFSGNAFKNGILSVVLRPNSVFRLMEAARSEVMNVDLEKQEVSISGGERFHFELDLFRKWALINGLDEINLTLSAQSLIKNYEEKAYIERPWLEDNFSLQPCSRFPHFFDNAQPLKTARAAIPLWPL